MAEKWQIIDQHEQEQEHIQHINDWKMRNDELTLFNHLGLSPDRKQFFHLRTSIDFYRDYCLTLYFSFLKHQGPYGKQWI